MELKGKIRFEALARLDYLATVDGLLSTSDVAALLGLTAHEVRRLAMCTDGLQPLPDGKRIRTYRAAAVRTWLLAHPTYPLLGASS